MLSSLHLLSKQLLVNQINDDEDEGGTNKNDLNRIISCGKNLLTLHVYNKE